MTKHRNGPRPTLIALAGWLLALPVASYAATVTRFHAARAGEQIEISAPRADIVRVRIGRPALPEDASWAVVASAKTAVAPLDVADGLQETVLSTTAVRVRLNKATWRVTVTDLAGRVILADADDGAASYLKSGFRLHKSMPADAHYFGLGDKTGGLDRRGKTFTLWNTDAYGFGEAGDPLYKSIPFVLSDDENDHAFGLFMDNTWRGVFDFGQSERDVLTFGADGGPIDYYVMAGPDAKAVVRQYAWLTGTPPLAPIWAIGFQQSRYSYKTEAELRGIVDRLRADRLPSDVVYMDIDYQDKNRPFSVNAAAYPDLKKMFADFKTANMRVVMITDLHVADAPGINYAPYDTGKARDLFLKNADGSDYVAVVWPGKSVFPDFSRAKARDWWGGLYANFYGLGAAGFWNDMNEPAIFERRDKTMPLDVVHRIEEPGFTPRAASHAEMHNAYGMLNSRATYEGLLKIAPDERPFVLTRASYAGGQRYAATWTGDNSSNWGQLKLSTSMLANLGLSGFSYAGDDIGGFAGNAPSAELLTRWIEIGAFNPIFRDHAANDKPPQEVWVHGSAHEDIRRRYIEERYRLMTYLYGLAEENSRNGLPILRPVFLQYPAVLRGGADFGGSVDQFMLGGDLLIAPSPTMESPAAYSVRLPGAGWYDYWTGLKLDGASTVETPTLERLPVFVRPGAIIPRQPLVQSTAQKPRGPLELAVYPGENCRGDLYVDDGVSFAYRRDLYLRQAVRCTQTAEGLSLTFEDRAGRFVPWWTGFTVVVHGWTAATAKASIDGKALATRVDAKTRALTIEIADVSRHAELRIEP